MIINILKKKPKLPLMVGSIILEKLLIDIIYRTIISKYYNYAGFSNNYNHEFAIISWVLLTVGIAFFLLINKKESDRPSILVTNILFFLSFLPYTVCIEFGLFSVNYVTYASLFWMFLLGAEFLNVYLTVRPFSLIKCPNFNFPKALLIIVSSISIATTLILSYKYTNFRFHINILTVYDLRTEAEGYNISGIISYMYAWTLAVNPFIISYCLFSQKKKLSLIFIVCSLLNFGFDGSKTALFFPMLFLLITIIYMKWDRINSVRIITFGFLGISLLGGLEYYLHRSMYIASYAIRRMMLVENLNSSFYYDYFTTHEPDYFRNSVLRWLGFDSPYSNLPQTIGRLYLGKITNANCGLIADAVTNYGYLGIIGYPLLLVLVFRLFDKVSFNIHPSIKMCVAVYISVLCINSFLTTALLSHGILLVLVLMLAVAQKETVYSCKGKNYKFEAPVLKG